MQRTLTLVTVGAALLGVGCLSSNYVPQSRGRVSTMMRDNKVVLVRDGRVYDQGFFGGGLVDAVRGVPAAEGAARAYASRRRSGALVGIGGMLCSIFALGFMTGHATADGDHDNAILTEGLIATGCLVIAYGGLWRLTSAEPYRYDAINLFNDASEAPAAKPPRSWDVDP